MKTLLKKHKLIAIIFLIITIISSVISFNINSSFDAKQTISRKNNKENYAPQSNQDRFIKAYKSDDFVSQDLLDLGNVKAISLAGFYNNFNNVINVSEITIVDKAEKEIPYMLNRINYSYGYDTYDLNIFGSTSNTPGTSLGTPVHVLNDKNLSTGYQVKGTSRRSISTNNVSFELVLENPTQISKIVVNQKKNTNNQSFLRKVSILSVDDSNNINTYNAYHLDKSNISSKLDSGYSKTTIGNESINWQHYSEASSYSGAFIWVPKINIINSSSIAEFYTDDDTTRYVVPELHGGKLEAWVHDSATNSYDDVKTDEKILTPLIDTSADNTAAFILEITDQKLRQSILDFINKSKNTTVTRWSDLTLDFLVKFASKNSANQNLSKLYIEYGSLNNIDNISANEISNLVYFSNFSRITNIDGISLYDAGEMLIPLNIFKQEWISSLILLRGINISNLAFGILSKSTYLIGDISEMYKWLSVAIVKINLNDFKTYSPSMPFHNFDSNSSNKKSIFNPKFVEYLLTDPEFLKIMSEKTRLKKPLFIDAGNADMNFYNSKDSRIAKFQGIKNVELIYNVDSRGQDTVSISTKSNYVRSTISDPVVTLAEKDQITVNNKTVKSILLNGEWVWDFASQNIDPTEIVMYHKTLQSFLTKAFYDTINPEYQKVIFYDTISTKNVKRGSILQIDNLEKNFSIKNLTNSIRIYLNKRPDSHDKEMFMAPILLRKSKWIIGLSDSELKKYKFMFTKNEVENGKTWKSYYMFEKAEDVLSIFSTQEILSNKISQINIIRNWSPDGKIDSYLTNEYLQNPTSISDDDYINVNNIRYNKKVIYDSKLYWDESVFPDFDINEINYFDGRKYFTKKFLEKYDFNVNALHIDISNIQLLGHKNTNKSNRININMDPLPLVRDVLNLDHTNIFNLENYFIKINDDNIYPILINGKFSWPKRVKTIFAKVFLKSTGHSFYISKDLLDNYLHDDEYSVYSFTPSLSDYINMDEINMPVPGLYKTIAVYDNADDPIILKSIYVDNHWYYYNNSNIKFDEVVLIDKIGRMVSKNYIVNKLVTPEKIEDYIKKNIVSSLKINTKLIINNLENYNILNQINNINNDTIVKLISNGYYIADEKHDYVLVNGKIVMPESVVNNAKYLWTDKNGIVHFEFNPDFIYESKSNHGYSIESRNLAANSNDTVVPNIVSLLKQGDNIMKVKDEGKWYLIAVKMKFNKDNINELSMSEYSIFYKIKFYTNINNKLKFYESIDGVPKDEYSNLSSILLSSNKEKSHDEDEKIIKTFDNIYKNYNLINNKKTIGLYGTIIISVFAAISLMLIIYFKKIKK